MSDMHADRIEDAAKGLEGDVYFYVEGYPFTTFGRFNKQNSELQLPPLHGADTPEVKDLNWDLFWDVRVFSSKGEWHFWRTGRGQWLARKHDAGKGDILRHAPQLGTALPGITFALWGTKTEPSHGDWNCLTETNGARVWVPKGYIAPVCLKAEEIIEYDDNGIAGIVDVALTGFEGKDVHDSLSNR